MSAHQEFIEKYMWLKNPDGTFSPIELTEKEKQILHLVDQAEKKGVNIVIFKPRSPPYYFGFGPKISKP